MGRGLMIQGTASGAGKSTLVAGLCRIFRQAGYSVAPFKAQNLSNNAHTLSDGRQIARSQAIAAAACGVHPTTDMNPVLLMPDTQGVQVVLGGCAIGYMADFDYPALKCRLASEVLAAYERLLAQHDIVVVEGAGSPVEMNLKENDIVNMGFARAAHCPVLLAADISRGGVFASVYGTMQLLSAEERTLVRGIVVNKFQGEVAYFQDGIGILEQLTEKPVLGVLPYAPIRLEDEDALWEGDGPKTRAALEAALPSGMSYQQYMDEQLNELAQLVRENLNMDEIYRILQLP